MWAGATGACLVPEEHAQEPVEAEQQQDVVGQAREVGHVQAGQIHAPLQAHPLGRHSWREARVVGRSLRWQAKPSWGTGCNGAHVLSQCGRELTWSMTLKEGLSGNGTLPMMKPEKK